MSSLHHLVITAPYHVPKIMCSPQKVVIPSILLPQFNLVLHVNCPTSQKYLKGPKRQDTVEIAKGPIGTT